MPEPAILRRAARGAALLLVASTACHAGIPLDDPPTTRPSPAGDLLRGPAVLDTARPSLVASDMEGRFRRVEGRPEEAALAMLALEPAVREAAKRILDARLEAIREHILDEIDLLRESSDATRAGDRKRAEELQTELFRRFEGSGERAPLLSPLAEALPADAHAELVRMVDEYWRAWIASETAGNRRTPESVEARFTRQLFQDELTTVHNATLRPLQQKLDRIYELAEVSDAQRAAIRAAVIEHVKRTRLRPSDDARLALARAILGALDEAQRERLFAAVISSI